MAITAVVVSGCMNTSSPDDNTPTTGISTQWFAAPSGKYLVQGAILQKYLAAGASNSALGSPITSEQAGPNGGRYNTFEGGAIYWTLETGAHIVTCDIRNAWQHDYGGACGALGYPASDQQLTSGGLTQHFQHGAIVYANGRPQILNQP